MSELPRGWVEAELGTLADFVMGQAPPGSECNQFGDGTPFVKAGEFGTERPIIREWTTKPLKIAETTDVLICVVGATAGKINLGADCAIGRSVAAIRPSAALDQHFLHGFLSTKVESLRSGSVGSAQGVISKANLSDLELPLPPLAEQKRIVAKLDALATKSARARTDLARIDTLVTRYKQAVLSKAFSGEPTNAQGGNIRNEVTVGAIVTELDQGWSPKCERVPATEDDQWAVITTTSIQPISFDSQENKSLPVHLEPRPRLQIEVGDILITRAGPRVRCGVCCYVSSTRSNLMLCDKAYRLRLNNSFDPEFFVYLMNSPDLLSEIERIKTGGNDSGLNLTQERFKALKVPLWSMNTQKRCVLVIKDQFAKIDRLAAEAKRALELVGKLDEAILAKAFKGQLVPQDPDDEPASVLLERIKAERAAAPKAKRGRGKKP